MKAARNGVYQTTTYIAVALLLLILFVSAAYLFFIPQTGLSPQQDNTLAALNVSRELWESRRPTSFRYIVDRACVCANEYTKPYAVTNRNGERTAKFAALLHVDASDSPATPPDVLGIADLFELVHKAALEARSVAVSYDLRFGYPTRIAIDWSEHSSDDDEQFHIRDFEVIEFHE